MKQFREDLFIFLANAALMLAMAWAFSVALHTDGLAGGLLFMGGGLFGLLFTLGTLAAFIQMIANMVRGRQKE